MTDDFRWQAFFQRSTEPLFLLNRQFQLLFVNEAWEKLTGLSFDQASRMSCSRTKAPTAGTEWLEWLRHVLTPPNEARQGKLARARRLIPAREGKPPCWWDVEHVPLVDEKGLRGILGKITVGRTHDLQLGPPLPESLEDLRQRYVDQFCFDRFLARVPTTLRVLEQAQLASQIDSPVLLIGEPGTGKRRLAKVIHYQSNRREQVLADLDCARLPGRTIEAILFAESPASDGVGAVFLKDPASLPREIQVRLAQAIPNDRLPRIFASAVRPQEQFEQKRLLEDLFHALCVFRIDLPTLRQRRDEIPHLIDQELERLMDLDQRVITTLTADAWEIVLTYDWPGNLAELCHVLRGARNRCESDRLDAKDLPAYLRQAVQLDQVPGPRAERSWNLKQILEEVERRLIVRALRETGGQKAKAAELLSISRAQLGRRMEALNVEPT